MEADAACCGGGGSGGVNLSCPIHTRASPVPRVERNSPFSTFEPLYRATPRQAAPLSTSNFSNRMQHSFQKFINSKVETPWTARCIHISASSSVQCIKTAWTSLGKLELCLALSRSQDAVLSLSAWLPRKGASQTPELKFELCSELSRRPVL